MADDQRLYPQRKSPRLRDYDYSQEGAYFVTVCAQGRVHLFGVVAEGEMRLNPAGVMVAQWWEKLPGKFPDIELDQYIVMPNHFHSIVVINRFGLAPRTDARALRTDAPAGASLRTSLFAVMDWFKTMTTNAYIHGVKKRHWQPFPGKLWQRSYHDHIIRHEVDLNRLREYTIYNAAHWDKDIFYCDQSA